MEHIVTAKEMKIYDRYTTENIGIPSLVLMERAAIETADVLSRYVKQGIRVVIFAGTGNNGGDALAAGRILAERGAKVTFYMPGDEDHASVETARQISIVRNLGYPVLNELTEEEYDIVIDGLFGTGLSRNITGDYEKAIQKINRLREKGALVAAVDIPSGINADSGRIMGCCVEADITVTFEYGKAGHYFYPGKLKGGRLFVKDIGISNRGFEKKSPSYFAFGPNEVKSLLPQRDPDGNKGTFGKVLLLAGSLNMAGAAILCGRSILRCGAGMVRIVTPKANRLIIQETFPEAMLYTYDREIDTEKIEEFTAWADVIVAGPGLSKNKEAEELMTQILKQKRLPMVIDADGLNLIAESKELKKAVKAYERGRIIMTPHPGEFVRLSGVSMARYKEDRRSELVKLAEDLGCMIIGKDAVTLAVSPGRECVYMNLTGNDGMATAGSGDVLAGVIGGFWAQNPSFETACLGIWIHGAAGDRAAIKKSRYGVTASDIIDEICQILAEEQNM